MNPQSLLSHRIAEQRRQFFETMTAHGIDDERFLTWFWDHEYLNNVGQIHKAETMYEDWKAALKYKLNQK